MYDKKSDLPLSRDGAWHLIKQRVAGITRARLMKFLKAQSPVESTRNSRPQPTTQSGVPKQKFSFETDLVFVRRPDFVKIHQRFETTIKKHETYISNTVEKITGLCRLDYLQSKDSVDVTRVVIKQLKSLADQLGIDLKQYEG